MVWQFIETIQVTGRGRHQSATIFNQSLIVADVQPSEPINQGRLLGWIYQSFSIPTIGDADSHWQRVYEERKLLSFDVVLDGYRLSFVPHWYAIPIQIHLYAES